MAMGKRDSEQQQDLFITHDKLPRSAGHVFYRKLNQLLSEGGFDRWIEALCEPYYCQGQGRPSVPPGQYFRMLLVGYFEGIGSQRGIAWRCSDSLSLRDFLGADPDVDWVMDASLDAMRKAGATIVDVRYPKWLLDAKQEFYNAIRRPEFHVQIAEYLKTTGPGYPKTLEEMIERSNALTGVRADGAAPNPGRWTLFKREAESGTLDDYRYTSVRDHGLPMVRAAVEGVIAAQRLDAIVYPTSPRRPGMIAESGAAGGGAGFASATDIANLTGFPDLIVPAGFTGDNLPVGISFFGPAFSEPKLLSLGFSFEQATHARRRPVHTPARPGETITIP
jgi:amidase